MSCRGLRKAHPAPSTQPGRSSPRGAAEKTKRENDAHLRQLAKKYARTYFFFKVRFWAFLGKGEVENTRKR
jgi:hypothetical protein